jgi:hypothetical protein
MDFHAIEAGGVRVLRTLAELLDKPGYLIRLDGTRNHDLVKASPSTGSADGAIGSAPS